jgi:competence protein ComEC
MVSEIRPEAIRGSPPDIPFRLWPRPLVWLTVAFASGILADHFSLLRFSETWLIAASAFLLLTFVIGLIRRSPLLCSPLLPLLIFFGLGAMTGRVSAPILPNPAELEPFFSRPQTLFLAEVSSPPEFYQDRVRLHLGLKKALLEDASLPLKGGVLLTLPSQNYQPGSWLPGDRLLVRLTLKRFHNFNNPGGYDYQRNQAERGLHARATLSDERLLIKLADEEGGFISTYVSLTRKALDRFRQGAMIWIHGHLDSETASLYSALLLGYRNLLPKTSQEHLVRAGVSHLLAISGLHLGLVSLTVFWLICRSIRIVSPSLLNHTSDRHIALWIALLAAILYALISGLALPTWRSAIMLVLFFGALWWYRTSDATSALATAALLILLISPASIRQAPFQLSFAAMAGLFYFYPKMLGTQTYLLEKLSRDTPLLSKILKPFSHAFWVSLAANLMVLPILAYHFHGISLAGFLANTLLVPAVGFLVLPVGLASIALYALDIPMAHLLLILGGWSLKWCMALIIRFSDLSWSFFWVGAVPVLFLLGYYSGMFIVLSRWSRRRKTAAILIAVVLIFGGYAAKDLLKSAGGAQTLQVDVIDVGQGSSTLLRFPTGETMLVDGGGFFDDSFDLGRAVLAPFLWHFGIKRLDHVVLSHDHPDHRNGLRFILSHFDIGYLWESGVTTQKQYGSSSLSKIARRRGITVRKLPEILGEHTVGECKVKILHPTADYVENRWDKEDLNNVSLVLQVDFGETHIVIPGDIDQSVERFIFHDASLPGETFLLIPHHGSDRSGSALLFDRLRPQTVAFSCGFDNWFGFPSKRIIEECRNRGIPFYRTDLNGAITAVSNGRNWDIKTVN